MDTTVINICISAFALILSVYNLILGYKANKEKKELLFFTEYTRRYQELIVRWPVTGSVQDNSTFYKLYFDLCSEEYYLHEKGVIAEEVWNLWKQGIQDAMRKKQFEVAWKESIGCYYSNENFVHFINNLLR